MIVWSTRHFKNRCKERNLHFKKLKKAALEGKQIFIVSKHKKIKIITEIKNNLIVLITAYRIKGQINELEKESQNQNF
ncbi:MAG: hypothetical protein IKP65_06695 [Alphaproteobacteria bacterium]|nr:hypothetical protein [Alphaproteobacteria bacterium]